MRFYSFDPIPLHIVGRCPQGDWADGRHDTAWDLFGHSINNLQRRGTMQTHAFVMMSNHYHWLGVILDQSDPSQTFSFSNWSASPKVHVLDHIVAYRKAYFYIYANPVAAGLVQSPQTYVFSTLPYVLGLRTGLRFYCEDHMNMVTHPKIILSLIKSESNVAIY